MTSVQSPATVEWLLGSPVRDGYPRLQVTGVDFVRLGVADLWAGARQ